MKAKVLYCPNCGTGIDFDEGQSKKYCAYCGTPVILDDEALNIHITNRMIDEARIKETDLASRKYEKQLEAYSSFEEKQAEWKKILFSWIVVLGVAFCFTMILPEDFVLQSIASGLAGVILLFGEIGVKVLQPKEIKDPNRPYERDYEMQGSYVQRNDMPMYSKRDKVVTFILCFFFGIFGAHYFYVGKHGTGIVYLLTAGLLGFG